VNLNTTFKLASAGKLLTQIAVLQCVERGLIGLDEPVDEFLPELKDLEIISKNTGPDSDTNPFLFSTPEKKITLRHLLTHSSGLAYDTLNPLLRAWRASRNESTKANTPVTDPEYQTPLLFEPGEGWTYGSSIEYVGILVKRLTSMPGQEFIKTNILEPLNMTNTTFDTTKDPEIAERMLQTVSRQPDGSLKPATAPFVGTISSVRDYLKFLSSLISPEPILLTKDSISLLFSPQLTRSAHLALQNSKDNYAACAGIPLIDPSPPIN
jgi:CubicO group peptidase (beta-lactamase class C family)